MRRMIRPVVVAAVCMLGLPLYGASGAPLSGGDLVACPARDAKGVKQINARDDHWTQIRAPKTDASRNEGPATITDYVAPPTSRTRLYATNGTVIKMSANAGCDWKTLWPDSASQLKVDHAPRRDVITNLVAPTDGSLYFATYDDVDGVAHPHVYLATGLTDGLSTPPQITEISIGEPTAGTPTALLGSIQPGLVYLVVEGPDLADPASGDVRTLAKHVYATRILDSNPVTAGLGLTWKEVSLPQGFAHFDGITPSTQGDALWLWSGKRYTTTAESLADSVAWTTKTAEGPVSAIDVNYGGITLIAVKSAQGTSAHLLDRAGKTLGDLSLPTNPVVIAHGTRMGVYAVAGGTRTYGFDGTAARWVDITPGGVKPFTKLVVTNGQVSRVLLAQAGDSIYRFDLYAGERFLEPPPIQADYSDWTRLLHHSHVGTDLLPHRQVVTVRPGELKVVPVDFITAEEANPLDVYFLMDSTGSMNDAIQGLKKSVRTIARRLRDTLGSTACFGLGDFKDFVAADAGKIYTRDVPVACDNGAVTRIGAKLDKMSADGGGADPREAQTIALSQAVTGAGQLPPNPIPIPPHQAAPFRTKSFKVIVLISDAGFNQGAGYPTIPQTVTTLHTDDVKVVSVLEETGQGDANAANARHDMEQTADGTETFAPKEGVDCDGNGTTDVQPGDPLVCYEDSAGTQIGNAIIGLLLGVVDPGRLAVDVLDEHHVVQAPLKGQNSGIFNLKRPGRVTFGLPVRCDAAQDGQDLPVRLLGSIRAVPAAAGEVVVRCRATPPVPPLPRPKPPVEPQLELPRPARPPVAVAVPNPPPAPAQPISNLNLNAGFSQQEEQQYQLAAVTQGAGDDLQAGEELELAMSDHRARETSGAGAMLVGAALLSSAATFAYRRRLQRTTRPGYVRNG